MPEFFLAKEKTWRFWPAIVPSLYIYLGCPVNGAPGHAGWEVIFNLVYGQSPSTFSALILPCCLFRICNKTTERNNLSWAVGVRTKLEILGEKKKQILKKKIPKNESCLKLPELPEITFGGGERGGPAMDGQIDNQTDNRHRRVRSRVAPV